jgi:hypothetical protein
LLPLQLNLHELSNNRRAHYLFSLIDRAPPNPSSDINSSSTHRRAFLQQLVTGVSFVAALVPFSSVPALAASTTDAVEVTDKIFIDIKGLGGPSEGGTHQRLVIGLFGKEAPDPVAKLKQLVSSQGLPVGCFRRNNFKPIRFTTLASSRKTKGSNMRIHPFGVLSRMSV